ncbi:MAG: heavy-metal-associated domain-containing protein [Acidimicrobiia bacterium]|nr:heavy-metal-associated domain-containing protein [Acidimicrobiia bacterium]
MTETTLSVPEIHCHHCKMSIEGAVGALPGVSRAAVDVPSATVALAFEPPATMEQIVAAIEAEGYAVPAQS